FSSHHAGEFVFESLIHAEQEPDLARADADVARGHVGLGSNVAPELAHERLTKARHFGVAFSVGIEIGTAFTAAHWKRSKRVFEDLCEREKFQDPKIDRRMKSEPAFVGADRAVHLDAEATIDVDLAYVVLPRHAEHDHPLGLDHTLDDFRFAVTRISIQDQRERLDHFLHRLVKLGLARVFGLHLGHQILHVTFHERPKLWQKIGRSANPTKIRQDKQDLGRFPETQSR